MEMESLVEEAEETEPRQGEGRIYEAIHLLEEAGKEDDLLDAEFLKKGKKRMGLANLFFLHRVAMAIAPKTLGKPLRGLKSEMCNEEGVSSESSFFC